MSNFALPGPTRGMRARRRARTGLLIAALAGAALAGAEEAPAPLADKSGFTLFHPTPSALMREFTTDRPDFTESPITVDAGHFQLEASAFDYTHAHGSGTRTHDTVLGSFNLKLGLTNNTDFEIVLDPYVISRTESAGHATQTSRGLGDALVRLKINLWGNDGPQPGTGPTAFGLMPFVKLPTATHALGNGRVEGGLILPFSANLPGGFDLSAMIEIDFLRNDANTAYGVEYVHSLSLGHKIAGNLAGYVEYVGISPVRTGQTYRSLFSTGLSYLVGKNLEFDAGTQIGLRGRADSFNVFSGFSIRF